MAALLLLTAIDAGLENDWYNAQERQRSISGSFGRTVDADDFGEDDLERPVSPLPSPENDEPDDDPTTSTQPTGEPPAGTYTSVAVPVTSVREFYPRKRGRQGTRIVFLNGAARLVKEPFAEVKQMFLEA